jgi:hypothetical protein
VSAPQTYGPHELCDAHHCVHRRSRECPKPALAAAVATIPIAPPINAAPGLTFTQIRSWFGGLCPGCRMPHRGRGATCGRRPCVEVFVRACTLASGFVSLGYAIGAFVTGSYEAQAIEDARVMFHAVAAAGTSMTPLSDAIDCVAGRIKRCEDRDLNRWVRCGKALVYLRDVVLPFANVLANFANPTRRRVGPFRFTLQEARDVINDYADRISPGSPLAEAIKIVRREGMGDLR